MIARWTLLTSLGSLSLFVVLLTVGLFVGQWQHGRELAFVRDEGENFSFNIYLMDVDRGITTRLTNRALWYDDFGWSPDGQQIAVELVTRDTEDLIYLVDMQGNGSMLTVGHQPAWSPDGARIAFVTRAETGCRLAVFELATQQEMCVSSLADAMPTWSPDGRYLGYLVGLMTQQIFIIDVQHAASARRVADSTEIFWSPDSRSLTYTLYRFGDYDVYSMNLETQVEQTLTDTLEDERYPIWSPDGLRLAYVATYGFADFLRILYPDGTIHNIDLSALIGRRVFVGEPPVWSSDSTQIVLSLITPSIPNAYSLYLVTLGNGIVNVRRLTEGGHSELHPAWRP